MNRSRARTLTEAAALLVVLFALSPLMGVPPSAHAVTVISITTSNGSTVCPGSLGGTWNGATETCSSGASGFTIPSGTTLDIGGGVTISGTSGCGSGCGGIFNDGTINNDGSVMGSVTGLCLPCAGVNNNAGTINNKGSITGIGMAVAFGGYGVSNGGTINNNGSIRGSGVLGFDTCGALNNNGSIYGSSSLAEGIYICGLVSSRGSLDGVSSASGSYGVYIYGFGTIVNNYGSLTGTANSGNGIYNTDDLNNYGTVSGTGGTSGYVGVINDAGGIINNLGSITADGHQGLSNAGTVNNGGSISGTGNNLFGYGVVNSGTMNDYSGATLSYNYYLGTAPIVVSCYTVTFKRSGVPNSGVTWGVTASWGPFTLPDDYTGTGASITINVNTTLGALVYTYDSPVYGPGATYTCSSGCSGTASVSGATAFTATYSSVAVVSITALDGVRVCPAALGGAWNFTTDTCSSPEGFIVPSGTTLDIGAGVNINATSSISNSVTNDGAINNYGRVNSTGRNSWLGVYDTGTIDNYGTLNGTGVNGPGIYIYNTGVINNYGTLDANSSGGFEGIFNTGGTIDNYGSLDANGGSGYSTGIYNSGTINSIGTLSAVGWNGFYDSSGINNEGTFTASGSHDGGFVNGGTVNDAGPLSVSGGAIGLFNDAGAVNDYCGAAISGSYGGTVPVVPVSCYTVSFDQSGIPTSGVTWGVTASWGPFVLPYDHTGSGAAIAVDVNTTLGALTYSYDSPVTALGVTHNCLTGCSGTASVSGSTAFTASYTPVATSLALSCAPSPVDAGHSTTCSASVTGSSPTGTLSFSSSSSSGSFTPSDGHCTLAGGACSVTYSDASVGSPTITVDYGGDANNAPSSASETIQVVPAVSLAPSSQSVQAGQDATFRLSTPLGTGEFLDWHLSAGLSAVSGCDSAASYCTVTSAAPGEYTVGVTETGQSGSTSAAPAKLTVTPGAAATTTSTTSTSTSTTTSAAETTTTTTVASTTASTSTTSLNGGTTTSSSSSAASTVSPSTGSTTGGYGNLPEFPYGAPSMATLAVLVAASYLIARRQALRHAAGT